MTRVICVANQKGGVGKTTTAINLAASLSVLERKTLLIDCDPQANATSGFGIPTSGLPGDLYSVFYTPTPEAVRSAIVSVRSPYLSVLPGSINLVAVEVELVGEIAREFYLQNVIAQVADDYEYIIIDCPPSLGLLTLNGLCAATELLIPLQCEYFALEGIAKLMATYSKVRKINPGLGILGVLLTMFDTRNRLSRDVMEEITSKMPRYMLRTNIPRNVRLSEAPSHGKSIIHYDIKSKGAIAYIGLAQEILHRKAIA